MTGQRKNPLVDHHFPNELTPLEGYNPFSNTPMSHAFFCWSCISLYPIISHDTPEKNVKSSHDIFMIALWNEFPSTRMKMLSFQVPPLPQAASVLQSRWAVLPRIHRSSCVCFCGKCREFTKRGRTSKVIGLEDNVDFVTWAFLVFFDSIFSFRVSRLREYAYVHTTWRSFRHPWGYDQEIWGIQPKSLLLL